MYFETRWQNPLPPSNHCPLLAPARSNNQGVKSDFGNINNNLYFSTVIAGSVRLITLNNQVPFHKGTPQYTWALKQFKSVDRKVTPWLFVMVHASPYHTWFRHYKVTLVWTLPSGV